MFWPLLSLMQLFWGCWAKLMLAERERLDVDYSHQLVRARAPALKARMCIAPLCNRAMPSLKLPFHVHRVFIHFQSWWESICLNEFVERPVLTMWCAKRGPYSRPQL